MRCGEKRQEIQINKSALCTWYQEPYHVEGGVETIKRQEINNRCSDISELFNFNYNHRLKSEDCFNPIHILCMSITFI